MKKKQQTRKHQKISRGLKSRSAREISSIHTLERLSREINASLRIEDACLAIYGGARELMHCDSFFIAIYDESNQQLNFVLRVDNGIVLPAWQIPLDDGMTSYVIRQGQGLNLRDVDRQSRFKILHWGVGPLTRSLVCVPLVFRNRVIGALSAQSIQLNAYDQIDLDIATMLAAQSAIAIENARTYAQSQRRMKQLEVLNQVGRIVSSTIEIDHLLNLIYEQLQLIFRADTYYVTLYDPERRIQRIVLLVDEGKRFDPIEIPVGEGLASQVLEQNAPLLVRNLSVEILGGNLKPRFVGAMRRSESWLGVPLMTAHHLLGVLAIASYSPNEFAEDDQEVLQNIATQAATAIYNARHHAEVEDQARRDSLTQAFNHGYLIRSLQTEIDQASHQTRKIALIMLDIDYFKEYNDRSGHLAGDAILRGTVQAIQKIIKNTDIIGRWGGEEFGIILLDSDMKIAVTVAERIRNKLTELKMHDDQGRSVPIPTVSQGIAVFPDDAAEAFQLVDVADYRLYQAKARGRDQIESVAQDPVRQNASAKRKNFESVPKNA